MFQDPAVPVEFLLGGTVNATALHPEFSSQSGIQKEK